MAPCGSVRGRSLDLVEPAHGTACRRSGDDPLDGLYVDLPAWGSHLFSIRPVADSLPEVHP